MLTHVRTATLVGIDAIPVTVETELALGLPHFAVVGLGTSAVRESRYRVQSALRAIGLPVQLRKITVNLAPADVRKQSAALDLAIALSILAAQEQIPADALDRWLPYAELGLDGRLRPVRGVLAAAGLAARMGRRPWVPTACGPEAALVGPACVADSLQEVVDHLRGGTEPRPAPEAEPAPPQTVPDLRDVRGQPLARRALEIAAAGSHNLLMSGHPGCGKTMLARRLPGILPPLTDDECLEVAQIGSAAGLTLAGPPVRPARPFRAPHRSISEVGMIGGGRPIRPGEVTLAHRGVLFLDEMPELPRRVLESLRQPLEDGEVLVARAEGALRLPASFQLVGAMNPCPCGFWGSARCACDVLAVDRYRRRISGPLLDRFDLTVELPPVSVDALWSPDAQEETSAAVRERVVRARAFGARIQGPNLTRDARRQLRAAAAKLGLSARAAERTVRVARTVANLDGRPQVETDHVLEALRFRPTIAEALV